MQEQSSATLVSVANTDRYYVARPAVHDLSERLRVMDTATGKDIYRNVSRAVVEAVARYCNDPAAGPSGPTLWAPAEPLSGVLVDTGYRFGDRVVWDGAAGLRYPGTGVVLAASHNAGARRCKGCRKHWQELVVALETGAIRYVSTRGMRLAGQTAEVAS